MGLNSVGLPAQIVLDLAKLSGISTFVETGTFCGETSRWAAMHFEKVFTIELSEPLFKACSKELRKLGNVEPFLGDSRAILPGILSQLKETPAVYWLDGHWSGVGTGGEDNECPLLEELKLLSKRGDDIILIDDARLFLAAPPKPHSAEQWPTIAEIINSLLHETTNRFIQIFDDVIFVVPNRKDLRDRLILEAQSSQSRSAAFWPKVRMKMSMLKAAWKVR